MACTWRDYGNEVFRIPGAGAMDNLVLPAKYLEELKRLPDDVLDPTDANLERVKSKYVAPGIDLTHLPGEVKSWISPALRRLRPEIEDEVKNALLQEVPQSSEWTEINFSDKMPRVVAMVTGRLLVGLELCRSATYVKLADKFTKEAMAAAISLTLIPSFLRPIIAPLLPQLWLTRRRMAQAEEAFGPTITSRRLQSQSPNRGDQVDILQLLIESSDVRGKSNRDIAAELLFINVAGVHSTSITIINALYWIVAKPELIEIMRQDVLQALATSGGEYSKSCLQQMTKLDSFLKEVMRCSLLASVLYNRKVVKPFTLSNGQLIPSGVNIEIPSSFVCSDTVNFEDPGEFDAFRFYNIAREYQDEKTGSYGPKPNTEFSAADPRILSFGYGRRACPGRFLAAAEIKMILGHILTEYEIKLPPGVSGRYKNLSFGPYFFPNPWKKILIRKLKQS
ncbi:unnamed protein product [Clonostachys rosea]|uniref:Cytochrome P450 n=1 Tax=Bionectria ochroleuca TaxID=29856 RepID=A0ABY6UH42_BIOOC|nr:unnamed protein product [Clonostachys rosea]